MTECSITKNSDKRRVLKGVLKKPIFKMPRQVFVMDKLAGERARLSDIRSYKQNSKYITGRYLPESVIHFITALLI